MAGTMMPTEADDLLAYVRESIERVATNPSDATTPHFVTVPGEASAGTTELERLQHAYGAVHTQATALSSLPPSPGTIRGQLGLSLVKLVHRLTWWSTSASARFADAVSQFARLQVEQEQRQRRLLTQLEKRVHSLETRLGSHPQAQSGDAEVVARILRDAGVDPTSAPVVNVDSLARFEELVLKRDASLGAVVCLGSEALSFRDVATLLHSAWRVLTPGGVLLLSASSASANADELLCHIMQRQGFHAVRLDSAMWIGTRP